jgi:hypothetical protein
LSTCKLNLEALPSVKRRLRKLKATYPVLEKDLLSVVADVQKCYEKACNADKLKFPGFPHLQGKIWKYDVRSKDLKRHPRECLRLVCYLEEGSGEATLSALICNLRRDVPDYFTGKEVSKWVKQLIDSRSNPVDDDESPDDGLSAA